MGFVALIPVILIINWGAYTSSYVKGQSIKANPFIELTTDLVHLLSFFLRINVQLIRVVIFGVTSYTYSELYLELAYGYGIIDITQFNSWAAWSSPHLALSSLLGLIAHLFFELGHLWAIASMQSGAFALIVIVITQFLYTTYLLIRMQEYFTTRVHRNIV
jgi:hypothetical protein